LTVN